MPTSVMFSPTVNYNSSCPQADQGTGNVNGSIATSDNCSGSIKSSDFFPAQFFEKFKAVKSNLSTGNIHL